MHRPTKPLALLLSGLLFCLLLASFGWFRHAHVAKPKVAAAVVAANQQAPAKHAVLASMPWYDGLVYLRNAGLPVQNYLPVVREGLRNTPTWVAHLRETSLLSHNQPWGEASNVITEAVMAEIKKLPPGLPQAEKGAELFIALFPSQPEALVASKLLWEQYSTLGMSLHTLALLSRAATRQATAPETEWLLEQAHQTYAKDALLSQLTETVWQSCLPVGDSRKQGGSGLGPLPGLAADIAFERQLAALPQPMNRNDLTVEASLPWQKLRGLDFQMRRYYQTATLFKAGDATMALSSDSPERLQAITAELKTRILAVR